MYARSHVAALTIKGAATRHRIILGAAELIRAERAEQIGLDEIRAATATSKSQLFHYFPEGRAEAALDSALLPLGLRLTSAFGLGIRPS